MKISYVIMAHEKRQAYIPYLKNILGNVPVSLDDNKQKLGTWGNCRRAWQMVDPLSDYGIVIQDDAILSGNFLKRVQTFVKQHPSETYQLFVGDRADIRKYNLLDSNKTSFKSDLRWGVAIGIKTELIPEMIEFADKYPDTYPDDSRIKQWAGSKKYKTTYPNPSLVDHRISPSLIQGVNNLDRYALNFPERQEIPKIIHQIWIGNKNPPKQWMASWRNIPGWEYELWDETKIENLNLKNSRLYEYYQNKKIYFGMADVARIEILNHYGGAYIDADTIRLKKWGGNGFLKSSFFAGQANTLPNNNYRIANGIIGSIPNHYILEEYIDTMSKARKLEPCWDTIGGTMLTKIVKKYRYDVGVTILQPYVFYPHNSRNILCENHRLAVCKHLWGSTHRMYR